MAPELMIAGVMIAGTITGVGAVEELDISGDSKTEVGGGGSPGVPI